jgi:hypothetical protein
MLMYATGQLMLIGYIEGSTATVCHATPPIFWRSHPLDELDAAFCTEWAWKKNHHRPFSNRSYANDVKCHASHLSHLALAHDNPIYIFITDVSA